MAFGDDSCGEDGDACDAHGLGVGVAASATASAATEECDASLTGTGDSPAVSDDTCAEVGVTGADTGLYSGVEGGALVLAAATLPRQGCPMPPPPPPPPVDTAPMMVVGTPAVVPMAMLASSVPVSPTVEDAVRMHPPGQVPMLVECSPTLILPAVLPAFSAAAAAIPTASHPFTFFWEVPPMSVGGASLPSGAAQIMCTATDAIARPPQSRIDVSATSPPALVLPPVLPAFFPAGYASPTACQPFSYLLAVAPTLWSSPITASPVTEKTLERVSPMGSQLAVEGGVLAGSDPAPAKRRSSKKGRFGWSRQSNRRWKPPQDGRNGRPPQPPAAAELRSDAP
eukprot:TRINITY_DN10706_c0_g1_i1.p1 TRINITY_DN10706_c0_g1~~TRINITY_DN10706_c0_g1_i1.p1  ORF type:complete len:359 (+),score=49.57 TRINITY_DN10706_c0_g1_i1:56-1078(+)